MFPQLSAPYGIILGCLIVAAAIGFTLHWDVVGQGASVYRLNRWTGAITWCRPVNFPQTIKLDCGD
jgi:hypothetical protein